MTGSAGVGCTRTPARHVSSWTRNSIGPNRICAPGGTGVHTPGATRPPESHVPLLDVSSRTRSWPPSNFSVACTPLTRGSPRNTGHCAGSRPTRTSEPGRIVNCPAAPRIVAPPDPVDGAAYGFGGGTRGWAFTAPVGGNPGTSTPPPPFVTSAGSGCPHEKQTEGWPGVAIVFIPHAGQRTSTIGAAPRSEEHT